MRRPDPIRRALVTGASSGIGEQFARQLAARGVDLVLVARRGGALEDLASELRAAATVEIEVLPADLTDASALATVVARLTDSEHPVDLLVNNAGYGYWGPMLDQEPSDVHRMVELNCTALLRLTTAIAPALRMRGRGGIINVGSVVGYAPGPDNAVYAATKAFVNSLTQAMHEELRPHGVRVTLLAPGATLSGFQERAHLDIGDAPGATVMTADAVVQQALDGFTRGSAVVVPGVVNRLAVAGHTVSPSRLDTRVTALLNRRVTKRRA